MKKHTLSLVEESISLSHGYSEPSSASAEGAKHGPQHTTALMAYKQYIFVTSHFLGFHILARATYLAAGSPVSAIATPLIKFSVQNTPPHPPCWTKHPRFPIRVHPIVSRNEAALATSRRACRARLSTTDAISVLTISSLAYVFLSYTQTGWFLIKRVETTGGRTEV